MSNLTRKHVVVFHSSADLMHLVRLLKQLAVKPIDVVGRNDAENTMILDEDPDDEQVGTV